MRSVQMLFPQRVEQIITCLLAGSWVESKLLTPYQADIVSQMAAAGMSTATAAGYLLQFLPQNDRRAELQSQVNDALAADAVRGCEEIMGVA